MHVYYNLCISSPAQYILVHISVSVKKIEKNKKERDRKKEREGEREFLSCHLHGGAGLVFVGLCR